MTKTLFLLILYTSAYGQVDTSKIKIINKTYHECVLIQKDSANKIDGGTENKNDYDTTPIYSDDISVVYPYIQTPDSNLNKFINDTIQKITGVYGKGETQYTNCNQDSIDLFNKPATINSTYKVNFINSRFISLTIQKDEYAGGGGNGFSDVSIPVTCDVKARKILKLGDVVKNKSYSLVYKIIIEQLRKTNQDVLETFDNEESLARINDVINYPISISEKGIALYWRLSYGRGEADVHVSIEFDRHEIIFDKKFREATRKK